MKNWGSLIKADPTEWLLEKDNPSVRYFTLTDILEKSRSDPEVYEAKSAIMETGTVPAILERQHKDGYWEDSKKFYTAKHKGTVWQLLILAELGAEKKDERIKKTCEFILETMLNDFDDGRSKSFYCLASALLSVESLEESISSVEPSDNVKLKAKNLKSSLHEKASHENVKLKLRKK